LYNYPRTKAVRVGQNRWMKKELSRQPVFRTQEQR
jgi:hypothetical protein